MSCVISTKPPGVDEARLLLDHAVPGIDGVYIHEKGIVRPVARNPGAHVGGIAAVAAARCVPELPPRTRVPPCERGTKKCTQTLLPANAF